MRPGREVEEGGGGGRGEMLPFSEVRRAVEVAREEKEDLLGCV